MKILAKISLQGKKRSFYESGIIFETISRKWSAFEKEGPRDVGLRTRRLEISRESVLHGEVNKKVSGLGRIISVRLALSTDPRQRA